MLTMTPNLRLDDRYEPAIDRQIVHESFMPQIVGALDVSGLNEFIASGEWGYLNQPDGFVAMDESHGYDGRTVSFTLVSSTGAFTSSYGETVKPHLDGSGDTLICSNILPTIAWVGSFEIPREHQAAYLSVHDLNDSGNKAEANVGYYFFETDEGQDVIAQAITNEELVKRPLSTEHVHLIGSSTIHSADPEILEIPHSPELVRALGRCFQARPRMADSRHRRK